MAVIALTSASGSPGVTTATLALAFSWPRPVLIVEADPTGGSAILAGYFRGAQQYVAGLVELALSPLAMADALADVVQPIEGSHVSFVAGTRSPAQAAGVRDLWSPLAPTLAALDSAGQDVLVDAGRLGLHGSPDPVLASADATLLVTRTSLPAIAPARAWMESVRRANTWRRPGVLLVGEGDPYDRAEVARVLDTPVLAAIARDDEAAAVYHRGATPPRRMPTSRFARSVIAAGEAIRADVSREDAELLGAIS
jgi:hypothetical protein